MAKKKRDVTISLEHIHPEFEGVNTYDLIDMAFGDSSMSMEAVTYGEEMNFYVPKDLQQRVDRNILNHDEWYRERIEARNDNKLTVVCAFSEGKDKYFEVYFGFAKASKIKHTDTTKQRMYSASKKYLFCALLISDPRESPFGIHARNDFEDEDFEKIAEYVTTHTRPKGKIYEIVNDYKLNEYNKHVLYLCQDRIDGFILGPKPDKKKK